MVYRCQWVKEDPIEQAYHDTEWGNLMKRMKHYLKH